MITLELDPPGPELVPVPEEPPGPTVETWEPPLADPPGPEVMVPGVLDEFPGLVVPVLEEPPGVLVLLCHAPLASKV